jgi:hypothetical protein
MTFDYFFGLPWDKFWAFILFSILVCGLTSLVPALLMSGGGRGVGPRPPFLPVWGISFVFCIPIYALFLSMGHPVDKPVDPCSAEAQARKYHRTDCP